MQERPFYTTFAWAYDLIIDAPVNQRCDFIERILTKTGTKSLLTILDAGCGTGNYAIDLATRGHHVTGVDSSSDQLEQASKKLIEETIQVDFVLNDLLRLNLNQVFDLILCRGVLNDILLDSERTDMFRSFAKVSKHKSILIFDVRDWQGSVRQKRANSQMSKEFETERGKLTFLSETELDEDNHMLVIHEKHTLSSTDGIEEHNWDLKMRCWTNDEIKVHLNEAGFEIVNQFGDYNEKVPLGTTERIVTIAKKL